MQSTIVHFTYNSSNLYINGGWVQLWPNTYQENPISKQRVQLLQALHIPLAPNKHYFTQKSKYFPFILIFPMLPSDWPAFDLVEEADCGGFCVKNITRNESGIYRVRIN